MQRVLVTGASGFIGRHVTSALLQRGVEVVALMRTARATSEPSGMRVHLGDLTAPDTIRGAADGCDTIVHLAGLSHRMEAGAAPTDDLYDAVNVVGARAILDEARRARVSRLVFMSSTSAAARQSEVPLRESLPPQPQDAYGRSKLRAEALIREAGRRGELWTVALRPPMVYGPGNHANLPRLMRLVHAGVPLPLGSVRNARSILYVGNLLSALAKVIERQPGSGDVYYLADAAPLSTPELIRLIGTAVGRQARLIPVPVWMLRAMGRIGDSVATRLRLPFTTQEIVRLTGSLAVDDSRIRADCGYVPPHSTAEGITDMARWFLASRR